MIRSFTYIIVLVLAVPALFANPSGYVGRTLPSSQGCGGGGCHASSASPTTSVSLVGVQAVTMKPGETMQFTIEIAHESRTRAGVNISVKSSLTSQTNAGTLIAGAGLFLSGGELTHSSPKTISGGKVTYTFSWKAPAEAGIYNMLATGNAVNGNGRQDANDIWNFMTPVQITVEAATSVQESSIPVVTSLASPLPSSDLVSVAFDAEPQERFETSVTDAQGQRVYEGMMTTESQQGRFQWSGTTTEGIPARNGVYLITLISDRRVIRSRALIIH